MTIVEAAAFAAPTLLPRAAAASARRGCSPPKLPRRSRPTLVPGPSALAAEVVALLEAPAELRRGWDGRTEACARVGRRGLRPGAPQAPRPCRRRPFPPRVTTTLSPTAHPAAVVGQKEEGEELWRGHDAIPRRLGSRNTLTSQAARRAARTRWRSPRSRRAGPRGRAAASGPRPAPPTRPTARARRPRRRRRRGGQLLAVRGGQLVAKPQPVGGAQLEHDVRGEGVGALLELAARRLRRRPAAWPRARRRTPRTP